MQIIVHHQAALRFCNIPQLSYTLSEPSCEYNFDASINISVVNGYPPYEFNWEDGKNGAFIENLS